MTTAESWRGRPDHPTVTPRIVTEDPKGLVGFLHRVFGADGEFQEDRPVELRFGDSIVMVCDGGGEREMVSGFLIVYVDDADAVHERALANGATSVESPVDKAWGDRRAMVRDGWGNFWQLSTFLG